MSPLKQSEVAMPVYECVIAIDADCQTATELVQSIGGERIGSKHRFVDGRRAGTTIDCDIEGPAVYIEYRLAEIGAVTYSMAAR